MPKKPKDVVLVHSPTPDGGGVNVFRARREGLEVGTMRPLEQGRPIYGEVVKLTPRPEMPMLYDVETEFAAPERAGDTKESTLADATVKSARAPISGPAQVASDSYRRNWDAIWNRSPKRLAN